MADFEYGCRQNEPNPCLGIGFRVPAIQDNLETVLSLRCVWGCHKRNLRQNVRAVTADWKLWPLVAERVTNGIVSTWREFPRRLGPRE